MNDFFEKVPCANFGCNNTGSKAIMYEKQGNKYFCKDCQFNESFNRISQDINIESYEQQALVMQIAEKEKKQIWELIEELRNERKKAENIRDELVSLMKSAKKLLEDSREEKAEVEIISRTLKESY